MKDKDSKLLTEAYKKVPKKELKEWITGMDSPYARAAYRKEHPWQVGKTSVQDDSSKMKLERIANLAYNLYKVAGRQDEAIKRILKIASPELYSELFGR